MGYIKKSLIGLLTAAMIYGSIQISKKPKYYFNFAREIYKIKFDLLFDNSPRINHDEIYIDTHMHIREPSCYKNGLEEIISTAMEKVDAIVVMTHNTGAEKELNYETFKKKVKEDSKYKVQDYGKYIEIKTKDDRLIAIKAQEITSNEGRHVLAIGCDGLIRSSRSVEGTIDEIHKKNGIAIIAHPMSIETKECFFPYKLVDKEDMKSLEKVCYAADAIEEFNSQNYLWMFRSNVLADLFVKEHRAPGTAGSDTHFDLSQIGLSGIIVKTHLLDMNNLIEDLRTVIRNKNFRIHKEYTDPVRFTKTIIIPFFERRNKK